MYSIVVLSCNLFFLHDCVQQLSKPSGLTRENFWRWFVSWKANYFTSQSKNNINCNINLFCKFVRCSFLLFGWFMSNVICLWRFRPICQFLLWTLGKNLGWLWKDVLSDRYPTILSFKWECVLDYFYLYISIFLCLWYSCFEIVLYLHWVRYKMKWTSCNIRTFSTSTENRCCAWFK